MKTRYDTDREGTRKMYVKIPRKHNLRVFDEDEEGVVLEMDARGEFTCFKPIVDDLVNMGLDMADAEHFGEVLTDKVLHRGLIETIFDES